MKRKAKRGSSILLTITLILFILEAITLPFVINITFAGRSEAPDHILSYNGRKLVWDSASEINADGSVRFNLFDAFRKEGSDECIIAPGMSSESIIRLTNDTDRTVNYTATLYSIRSNEDLPVSVEIFSEGAELNAVTPILPEGIELSDVIATCSGELEGNLYRDFDVSWVWEYYESEAQDLIDTHFGALAAAGDPNTVTVGLYITVEEGEDSPIISPDENVTISNGKTEKELSYMYDSEKKSVIVLDSEEALDEIVDFINNSDSSDKFEIDASGLKVDVDSFELPVGIIKEINKILSSDASGKRTLILRFTDGCYAEFDAKAWNAVCEALSDATYVSVDIIAIPITSEQLNDDQRDAVSELPGLALYDIKVYGDNGKEVTEFDGGTLKIGIGYALKKRADKDDVFVYHVAEGGSLEKLTPDYDKETKTVSFELSHLSIYAISSEHRAVTTPGAAYGYLWLWIILITLSVLTIIGIILFILLVPTAKLGGNYGAGCTAVVNEGEKAVRLTAENERERIIFAAGKSVELSAECGDGYVFVGWFAGKKLISGDAKVSVEKLDRFVKLEARFELVAADADGGNISEAEENNDEPRNEPEAVEEKRDGEENN